MVWPALIVACLALGAWLMSGADPPPRKEVSAPAFPRYQSPKARARAVARRTSPPVAKPALAIEAGAEAEAPPAPAPLPARDPMITALSRPEGGSALFMEANVLLHSPVGEMLLGCLDADARREIDRVRDRFGVDLFSSIDRVAVQQGLLTVSGHFGDAEWENIFEEFAPREHGDYGMIYSRPDLHDLVGDGGAPLERQPVMGVWNDELVFVGDTPEEVAAAMDRLEGNAPTGPPPIKEHEAYGEIYGTLQAEDFGQLLAGGENTELSELLKRAAERVELHVDARDEVAIVARARGTDTTAMEKLSRALGGALSLGRIKARQDGDDDLAALLEHARVTPFDGDSTLELALPRSTLREWLGDCASPAK